VATPSKIPEEVKAEAKRLYESGLPGYTVAKRLGVNYETLRKWTRVEGWVQTLSEPVPQATGLDSVLAALSGGITEDTYDERLRQIALSVPFILGRLDVSDLVAKADKVCKLIDMSREVLGKSEKSRNTAISVGILSAGGLPRRAQYVELIDSQQVVDSQDTGS
jgi:transposase-like protein